MLTRAAILFGLVGALCISAFSEPPHPIPLSSEAHTPAELLYESYQLSQGLIPPERAVLLNYLSRTAGEHRLEFTSRWADENYRLAQRLPLDWNRVAIEKNAIVALSYVQPRRALALLRTMDLPVSNGDFGFPEDVRSDAATIVFMNYWNVNKLHGVQALRTTALYLGQTGEYPYRGIGVVISDISRGSRHEAGGIPTAAQNLLLDAYSAYQNGSKFGIENDDFVDFLQKLRPILPSPMFRKGLELAVDRLLDKNKTTEKQVYSAAIQTENGFASFHSRQDKLLYDLLPLIREVDSDWAVQLIQQNPVLAQAGGHSGKEITSEGTATPGEIDSAAMESPSAPSYGIQEARAQGAGELAGDNPSGALKLAQSISDPALRTVALANIARSVGPSDPGRAKELEETIKNTMPTISGSEDRLQALAALARAASAADDRTALHDALKKCFTLGEELFEEEADAHPAQPTYQSRVYDTLDGLIRSTSSMEKTALAEQVEGVRNIALKAYLLHSLAAALYTTSQH